jgi:hypothetical protein
MTRIIHVAMITMPRIFMPAHPQWTDCLTTYCTLLAVWKGTFYHAATMCSSFLYFDPRKSCATTIELYIQLKTPSIATSCRIFTLRVANLTITDYLRRIRLLLEGLFLVICITRSWSWTLVFHCFTVRRIICHSVSIIVLHVFESC